MPAATLLAASAGGVGALGATDLAQAWSARRKRPPRRLALALLARAGRGLAARAPRDLAGRIEVAGLDVRPGDVMAGKNGAAPRAPLGAPPPPAPLPRRPGAPGRA